MRVSLDHCVDVHFAKLLSDHDVRTAQEMGWQSLSNGELLAVAEEAGFVVMITTDKNVRHQQNLAKRKISLITPSPRFVDYDYLAPMAGRVMATLNDGFPPGSEILIGP